MTSVLKVTSPRTRSWKVTSTCSGTRKRMTGRSPASIRRARRSRDSRRQRPAYRGGRPAASPPGDRPRASPASRSSGTRARRRSARWRTTRTGAAARTGDTGRARRRRRALRPSRARASAGPRGCSASDSRVDRSASVSSMRRMNVPSLPCASSQLNSAVRALPTWSCPVGLGAKRTAYVRRLIRPRTQCSGLNGAQQRDGVRGDRLAAADRVHAFVGLALDAHRDRPATPSAPASPARIALHVRRDLRPLEHDDDVDVDDREAGLAHDRRPRAAAARGSTRPSTRIGVGKMPADVAQRGGAEHRVGRGMADDVGVGVPERADGGRDLTPPRISGRPSTSRCRS